MAQKRMFTMKIVDSDAFLDMPLSSQCLYFHLNMRADDDGFVGNTKRIMRMIGASEDDLKILLAKRFLILFEDNVVVIKHWWLHNTLVKDRYHETTYTDEKAQLFIKENKAYTLNQKEALKICNQNDNKMLTECIQDVNADLGLGLDKDLDKDINLNLDKKQKHKNGIYQNVLLTDSELMKLCETLGPDKAKAVIDNFSELKEMKGYKYKSDYLALKKWGIDAYEKRNQTSPKQNKNVKQDMANFFDEN